MPLPRSDVLDLSSPMLLQAVGPQGCCIAWGLGLPWLLAASDGLIAISSFAIPIGLYRLIRRNGHLPFARMLRPFAAFVLACGTTHLLGVWTIWYPAHGIGILAKAATAAISLVAAIVFVRAAPALLELPRMGELEARVAEQSRELTAANEGLRSQMAQRDEAEQALAERESRLRSIVDTAVNAILTLDEAGTVESMNPAAVRLFGYGETEVVGRNVSMLMGPPHKEAHDQYLRNYLETGQRRIIGIGREVQGWRKDGTVIPLDLAVSEFESARGRRFTGVLSDVSARKEAARRLAETVRDLEEANTALRERNTELDDFAYTVAHDLKEPLRGIQTYCMAVDEDLGGRLPQEARSAMERVQGLAERMHRMIESMLDYSRLGRETTARRTDLNETLRESLDMLSAAIQERGCVVDVPRPLPFAKCDPTATAEVLKNLISNASKYNDKNEKRIEIGWSQPDGEPLAVYVRDNGIGIQPSQLAEVFRIFHRLHGRSEDSYGGGSGAGLAIVKKLAERQGGRVWVESVPGEGSTFWFTLGPLSHDEV